jgi:Protein of unknown function (DUF3124).
MSIFGKLSAAILVILVTACSPKKTDFRQPQPSARFDPNTLVVKDESSVKKVRGQVLYLPVYSNVPFSDQGKQFDLSAFVAVHNTDLRHPMKITRVLFFDNHGNLVNNYLTKDSVLKPLGATNFFVPEKDKSGTGANFIVEWVADTVINEPLIETVMLGLKNDQGVSFSSVGRIIREAR